ncbi:hypothetical protein ABFY60_26825 [Lysinibacillus pakistanensis]|uniref:hypothetical protein n=1 Tax=Lysinibacillus pakistanensis TaxID=759811 RepID=UPI003D2B9400
MISPQKWDEFKNSGLLWFINQTLHLFGWAIVVEIDNNTNEIINVYPARVKFRGFDEKSNTEGYIKLSEYLQDNIKQLTKEAKE